MLIDSTHLSNIVRLKYGAPEDMGWGPRLRIRFGYSTPDDWYEAVVFELVTSETLWLDVGCGRSIFPSNFSTAKLLAERCRLLVGLDPSDNIEENTLVHEKAKCSLQEYETSRQFDLITLRMVAEHVTDPQGAVAALSRLAKPGGRVIVYTVSKWSPVTLVSAMTPIWVHHVVKRFLWNTDEKDTFPITYRMNTRKKLQRLFSPAGFHEEEFQYLDDCRSTLRWRMMNALELTIWKVLRSAHIRYPETCILGIYRKDCPRLPSS